MEKQVIKSIQNNDTDILIAIKHLYLKDCNFDLDPCYSTGQFYGDSEKPRIKMDKIVQNKEVIQNDILNGIPLPDKSIESIVFDPPFMFGQHGQTKNNLMTKRFTMFDSWEDLETLYKKALSEFYRILKRGGIVAFKCQDYTDSKTTLTHCFIHNWAIESNFMVEDLFIKICTAGRIWNSALKQKHARKLHAYWIVLKKVK